MKKNIFRKTKIISLFVIMIFVGAAIIPAISGVQKNTKQNQKPDDCGCPSEETNDFGTNDDGQLMPVMRMDEDTLDKWQEDYENARPAYIDPSLEEEIANTESYSILDLLEYDPETRSQGRCGNCWAWPSTSVLAIALNVQQGIKDRLSVQFINTCGEDYTRGLNKIECCGGGNMEMFANFYENTNFAIPWSNNMAHWHDGGYINCQTDCREISKTPNYPIYEIDSVTIDIRSSTEEAIENIKNILHQQRGIYFSVVYPDNVDLDRFRNMWQNDAEEDIYDLDGYCGNPYNPEEGVGHAMLIVGYYDEADSDENDHWIVLNSWGTTENRPNGILRWEMHMDYDCKYSNYYAFGARTLDVSFEPNPEAPLEPEISGPSNGKAGNEYTFEVSAVDPQGDDVYIWITWENKYGTGWEGPYASGEKVQFTHTWSEDHNYVIRARARDEDRDTGPWASYDFVMSRDRQYNSKFNIIKVINHLLDIPFLKTIIEKYI